MTKGKKLSRALPKWITTGSITGGVWTFEQAVSYYRFAVINYLGFHDRGMLLAGGCGSTNGRPGIGKTGHLEEAYRFGKAVYPEPEI